MLNSCFINGSSREQGLSIRTSTIECFTDPFVLSGLSEVLAGGAIAHSMTLPQNLMPHLVRGDMESRQPWQEEFWSISSNGSVSRCNRDEFMALPAARRFSNSDCLRRPRKDAFALRGLLSGLRSEEVSSAFLKTVGVGRSVSFMTADIARYRPNHYLRRHDDAYDGRLFGMVFFLHDAWMTEYGTRLVVEKPDGQCAVVSPKPETFAMMRLANGYYHQVEPNFSEDWTRLSIAVHFGVK